MKKRVKQISYMILALCVLAGGYLMPKWWINWQDSKQAAAVEDYAVRDVSLQVSNVLINRMKGIRDGANTLIEVESNAYAYRTQEEIEDITWEAMNTFTLNEVSGGYTYVKGDMQEDWYDYILIIDDKDGMSYGIWNCSIIFTNWSAHIILDDETGMVLAYECYGMDDCIELDDFQAQEEELRKILTDYYDMWNVELKSMKGFEGKDLEEDYIEENEYPLYDGYTVTVTYSITDGQGNTINLNCVFFHDGYNIGYS